MHAAPDDLLDADFAWLRSPVGVLERQELGENSCTNHFSRRDHKPAWLEVTLGPYSENASRVMIASEFVFGIFLLGWLNTPSRSCIL
jgi:hypothetical protein